MSSYQPRQIEFQELVTKGSWSIKVYTITKHAHFGQAEVYRNALQQLPAWLNLENSFDATHEGMAFLIIHEGTEGVFSLVNWWVGSNMLNTHIFFTKPETPEVFTQISGDGLAPCVWELEVINRERVAWINHTLKPETPNYQGWLADTFSCEY